jgi:hypothetical protein
MHVMNSAALVMLLAGSAYSAEIEVGKEAPELRGTKWITKEGKDPETAGKVRVIDFWFAA